MSILFDGLSLGAIYALIALGYTMVYGIAKMLNFAHGDVIMVGAYAIFTTLMLYNNPIIAIIFAIIVCTIFGILIEKLAYKPLRSASPLAVLITAIGVSYFLQSVAQLIFGAESQPVNIVHSFAALIFGEDSKQAKTGVLGNIDFGSFKINVVTIGALIASALIMIALTVFVKKTKTGTAMIAVSEDKGAAQLMGINVNKIISITFAIGSALAAFASLFYLLQIPSSEPTLGAMPGIKAFTAAVIGGIGSIPGAMLGGILMGIIEKVCSSIDAISPYTTSIEFALLIIILLVKPIGLLGKKIREKV